MIWAKLNVIYNNKGSGISFTRIKDIKKTHFRKHEMFYNISPIASYIFSDSFTRKHSFLEFVVSVFPGEELLPLETD